MFPLKTKLFQRHMIGVAKKHSRPPSGSGRPLLEPLEQRDLLDGTPLVNAQSTTAQLFIEGIFEGLLERPVDGAGLDYWSSVLGQGVRADRIVLAIENSAEFSARVVDQLYSSLFQRSASDTDRAYWIDFLDRGGAIEQMEAAFLGSAEFSATRPDPNVFLQALYETALSRPLDEGGRQAWLQALAGGTSRGQVAASLLGSLEAEQLFIEGLYGRFLSRAPNPFEVQSWIQTVAQTGSRKQVFALIGGSTESIVEQANGVLTEIAAGALAGGAPTQRLFVQFNPNASAYSIMNALQWIDGSLEPGTPSAAGNSPLTVAVDVPARRTLGETAHVLAQNPNVASAQPDIGPVASVSDALSWLQNRSTDMIGASAVSMSNGITAFLPQVGSFYDGFWLRDFAYMLEGNPGAFSNQQAESAAQLFIDALRWDGAGVDSIGLNGTPYYEPQSGQFGSDPVADGSPFTVDVAWRVFQKTGDSSFVSRNILLLEKSLNSTPRDTDNGLVYIDTTRSAYGFTDLVPKRGDDLFCSLLFIRACRELSDLFLAVGAADKAAAWQATAASLTAQVTATFWDAQTGLFLAATQQCRQPDIWGSAFAAYLGVATPAESISVANYFKIHYSEIVQHGQLRELPGGMYWQNFPGPKDTYQNGGYWATPMGWFINTIDLVDHQMADQTILQLAQNLYVNGILEDIFGDTGWNPGYNSSAALPLAGITAMMQRRLQNGG
jgi:hypothetical protein